jgi:uncharacterized protein
MTAVRDELRPDSDVDLLVEFSPGARIGFMALGRMQRELGQLFKRPVDLVPRCGLKPLIRSDVLQSARVLYAARWAIPRRHSCRADAIARFIADMDDDSDFFTDELRQSAILQKLIVSGEAASRVSDGLRACHSEVEWADIVGFRNIAGDVSFRGHRQIEAR